MEPSMEQDPSELETNLASLPCGIGLPWDQAVAPALLMLCVHEPESSS